MTLPAEARQAGESMVHLLHKAWPIPERRNAIPPRCLNGGAAAEMDSFAMLMFSMNWYTMLGDVDRAYQVSSQWLAESRRAGLTGIPFNLGFWLPEMRPFRADARFQELARRMGLIEYWRKFAPPDDCQLQGDTLTCQ
jgi:hypothetical protein